MNSVKLYSNGSAVITKGFRLTKDPLKVTIPVKKEDLDDVVSSISVLGNVTIPELSYTPTNSNPTTLSIDAKNVLKELATKLRGSEATITQANGQTSTGRVFGIQTYQQETNGSVFERFRILLGTPQGVKQFEENDVTSLQFTDEFVQGEINKALDASFAAIKPDSRNVNLTLTGKEGDPAAVAYATPCAAWKTRYQLRLTKGKATLEAQAVVDNDTDDDWKEVNLSVITGEPISFSTDIADIRRPARSRVNVVSDTATGAVSAEDAIYAGAAPVPSVTRNAPGGGARALAKSAVMRPMAAGFAPASVGLESLHDSDEGGAEAVNYAGLEVAVSPSADVKESGDFSVYTSPNPVTILARKSGIVNLFSLPLDGAKTVLLYKPNKNERRPYTAIKFKNTTPNSLNKGVCEVYVEGDRQGKCVLENTKQDDESFLVHAVETGVKAFRDVSNVESKRVRIKITDSVAYCEQVSTQETRYRVQNSKGEAFQFEIEHSRQWNGSKLEVSVDTGTQTSVDTPTGCRVSTTLPAKGDGNGTLVVTVKETLVQQQQYGINPYWLQQNIVITNNPLARNKSIQKVIELQQAYDEVTTKINEAEEEVSTLTEEQERLINLIPSLHANQANTSKNELAEAEGQIKVLKKTTLPQLRKDQKAAEKAVQEAMSKLKTDWTDDAAPKAEGNGNGDKQ